MAAKTTCPGPLLLNFGSLAKDIMSTQKQVTEIPAEKQEQWKQLDFQLCALQWQSVKPNILVTLRYFKTCYSFWKKAQKIYTNDIQRLYEAATKLSSSKQIDHDMTSFVAQIQFVVE